MKSIFQFLRRRVFIHVLPKLLVLIFHIFRMTSFPRYFLKAIWFTLKLVQCWKNDHRCSKKTDLAIWRNQILVSCSSKFCKTVWSFPARTSGMFSGATCKFRRPLVTWLEYCWILFPATWEHPRQRRLGLDDAFSAEWLCYCCSLRRCSGSQYF